MTTYSLLTLIHATLGGIALTSFWTAAAARKGGRVHRLAGRIYLPAMTALLAIAVPMTVFVWQRQPAAGAFLAFLLLITGTSVWLSWRAVRDQRDWARYTGPVYRALMWLNLVGGLAMLVVGLAITQQMQFIITAFGVIGLVGFWDMWRFSRQPPAQPRWWLREHFGAMLGNGIATHIAFLSIGLPRLLPALDGPVLQVLAWLGPVAVAWSAGAWLTRRYGFGAAAKTPNARENHQPAAT